MDPIWVVLIVVGVVVLACVLVLTGMYNRLVRMRNEVDQAWAQIDVQLKRRHDLIPNLVETAKGYMTHERETFESVTRARNLARQAAGPGETAAAEQQLSQAMGQFFLVVEDYPELKANENFLSLQDQLTETENQIGFARQYYNEEVTEYNTTVQTVPTNIVAGVFGFDKRDLFEIELEAEREVPEVKF
jgi:LemA protein